MPSSLTCPEDHELLALAAGEEPPEELRAHLAGCSRCREQVEQYRVQMRLLRLGTSEAPLAPSTVSELASDHGKSNGRTHHSDTTAPRAPSEAAAAHIRRPRPTWVSPAERANRTSRHSRPRSENTWSSAGFPSPGRRKSFGWYTHSSARNA